MSSRNEVAERNEAAERLLGKVLGRHHRQMLVSGDRCTACNDYYPRVTELREALAAERALGRAEGSRATVELLDEALAALIQPIGDDVTYTRGWDAAVEEACRLLAVFAYPVSILDEGAQPSAVRALLDEEAEGQGKAAR